MKTLTVEQAQAVHEACMDRYEAEGAFETQPRVLFEECRNEDCLATQPLASRKAPVAA